ncbi:MAG: c-type cytochrome [Nitrospirota bacterium]
MDRRVFLMGALLCLWVGAVQSAYGADPEQGKKIYEQQRCGLCHAIGGRGGKIGPDLTDVGNQRDGEWLTKFLKDPKGTVPGAKMLPVKATDEELAALVDYLLSLKK